MNMGMGSGKRQGGNKQRHDPFGGFGMMSSHFGEDDFFGDSGFGTGGFTSFQSSSFGNMGGSGGMGESISTQTIIENGRQKTITKKTKIDRNGNKTTEVIEEMSDPRTGQRTKNTYIENGGNGIQGSKGMIKGSKK